MTYEYKTMRLVEHPNLTPPTTIAQDLNTQGLLGWRLAEVVIIDAGAPLAILERSTEWVDPEPPFFVSDEERHEFVSDEHCSMHCAILTCGQDREHPVHQKEGTSS